MSRKSYPSDLTDEQWEILGPLLPGQPTERGCPCAICLPGGATPYSGVRPAGGSERHPVFASERMPLADGPARVCLPGQTLYKYFRSWTMACGTWERVNETLRPCVREAEGRPSRSRAILLPAQRS